MSYLYNLIGLIRIIIDKTGPATVAQSSSRSATSASPGSLMTKALAGFGAGGGVAGKKSAPTPDQTSDQPAPSPAQAPGNSNKNMDKGSPGFQSLKYSFN